MTRRPNIVLIITDQERAHKHWPPGWAENNLPNHYNRLIGCDGENGRSSVVFPNAYTATTECSPSRASLLTSSYPTEHGVKTTPGALDPITDVGFDVVADDTKDDSGLYKEIVRPNLLRLLSSPINADDGTNKQEGYDVAWKGKWHLTPPLPQKHSNWSSVLKWYGTTAPWNPPDAGHSLSHSHTLGGGMKFNHDGRFLRGSKNKFDTPYQTDSGIKPLVGSDDDSSDSSRSPEEEEECIFDFIAKHTTSSSSVAEKDEGESSSQPFFLIASLVNPHDVWASGCFAHLTDEEFFKETGYHPREFESLPIDLPPNHKDDLSSKPVIQQILKSYPVFGDLSDETERQGQSDALRYVRFYAHLHKLVDAEIGTLLDKLHATGQMDNTIIVRMADHGELALSHGLREKRMQCYEETMAIPLVINYPSTWFDDNSENGTASHEQVRQNSQSRVVPNLVSSVDILPTIAELAGVNCAQYKYRGKSLVPFLRNSESLDDNSQDEILFTFDEPLAPPGIPGFVRCIRTSGSDFKYAVYFTIDGNVMEYEMYDLESDPYEMVNLVGPNVKPDERWFHYHDLLTKLMDKMGAIPTEFDWDELSRPRMYSWG